MPLIAFATAMLAGGVQARADNLFDLLFGPRQPRYYQDYPAPYPRTRGGYYHRSREPGYSGYRRDGYYDQGPDYQQAPAQRAPAAPVSTPKVAAPVYHDYHPDPLTPVDFSKVIAAVAPDPFAPSLQRDGFAQARGDLRSVILKANKQIANALVDYYAANPHFIWVSGFDPDSRAEQALKVLGDAASYGLNPADYTVEVPPAGYSTDDTSQRMQELMRFEVTLSARVLRYALDAHDGRVIPDRMSDYYDLPRKPLDLVGLLKSLSDSNDVTALLESEHPQSPQYQELRAALKTLRASAENDIVVNPDMLVKPGGSDPDFHKLIQLIKEKASPEYLAKYGALLDSHANDDTYSDDLKPLIKAAQKANGLSPDGVVGPHTVAALAGQSRAQKIAKVTLALEEMRWLPQNLGKTYAFINQPAFRVTFTKDGVQELSMRAIVGRPTNQTTFFYDKIEKVTFNPYWGVPRSILVNEMLPRLIRDPGYLDRSGYEVLDAKGNRIPSASIDWGKYGTHIPFDVRQEPGEQNALGDLKILFPNKHAIYMHDTPEKYLFKRDVRAFSHGCVRIQEPNEMAAAVLDTSVAEIRQKLQEGHSTEDVPVKIPVYIAYFTAWPDADGTIRYYNDIYGRDAHLTAAMKATDEVRSPQSAVLTSAVPGNEDKTASASGL